LWAAFLTYPRVAGNEVQTFEQRVQDCFRLELDGMGPPLDSPEMQGLVAYAQWLATGAPARTELPGRGFPAFTRPREISATRGAQVYAAKCALCHGADGRGSARADGEGYQFPPLWGSHSYTAGSALIAFDKAAGFIQANMPLGRANALSSQEAADVAAFLAAQDRPTDPRLGWLARLKRWFDQQREQTS
jgi:thiosulfate dehydrogenase